MQRGGELRLGPETPEEGSVFRQGVVEDLDRDAPPESRVLGDVHASARAGADCTVEQVPARKDAAREIAYRTAGHGFNGSGHVRAARVTACRAGVAAVSGVPAGRVLDARFRGVSLTRPEN